LKKHPKIMDAAVVGYPDPRLGERVYAFIVPKSGEKITLEEIKRFMEENKVAKYKWPEKIEIVSEIPRNPVGKVLKNMLRKKIKEKTRS